MKFKLINAEMYRYFCKDDIEIEIEKILSKVKATEYEDKVSVIGEGNEKEIHIEINTLEELRGLGLVCDRELIMSLDHEPPLITIYDGYIEYNKKNYDTVHKTKSSTMLLRIRRVQQPENGSATFGRCLSRLSSRLCRVE